MSHISDQSVNELLAEIAKDVLVDSKGIPRGIRKYKTNEHGVILLDKHNPQDREWYESE